MSTQTKFNSQLEVSETATFSGAVSISGNTTITGNVNVSSTGSVVTLDTAGVSITGSTTITGALEVNGSATFTGTVTITSGSLAVTGSVTITGSLKATTLELGNGSDKLTEILTHSTSIFFGSIAGNSVATTNATIAGVNLADFNSVLIDTPDILEDEFIVQATVVADDTVGLKLHNTSNSTKTAITATYDIVVFQFS
tara:strand:- start:911 stop:1504 length:594 start_codon:yes stop_codon:yes gene_type:complete